MRYWSGSPKKSLWICSSRNALEVLEQFSRPGSGVSVLVGIGVGGDVGVLAGVKVAVRIGVVVGAGVGLSETRQPANRKIAARATASRYRVGWGCMLFLDEA
jgi:hypothetical protein